MTNIAPQKIFKDSAVARMRRELSNGKSIESYYDPDWMPNEDEVWTTKIHVPDDATLPVLNGESWHNGDYENAVTFFEYYRLLDETRASDQRFWAYLSHVQFREYSFSRWAYPKELNKIEGNQELETKARNRFLDHWFTNDNSRSLRRHALARLWWAVKLTESPWKINPDYSSFDKDDPYVLTRALFLTQDVYQAVLERNLGRSKEVLFATLDFISKNPKFSKKKAVWHLTKGINLEYGIRKLSNLNRDELIWLLEQIASEYDFSDDGDDPEDVNA